MLLRVGLQGEAGRHVLLKADELEDGAGAEEVDLAREAAELVELGEHRAAAGAITGEEEVVSRLGIPEKRERGKGQRVEKMALQVQRTVLSV